MSDKIGITVGTKGADEFGPPSVVLRIEQGSFRYESFHEPEDMRRIGSALLDAANEVELNVATTEAMRRNPPNPHPCPYCGAADNLRCCEFGRDS